MALVCCSSQEFSAHYRPWLEPQWLGLAAPALGTGVSNQCGPTAKAT